MFSNIPFDLAGARQEYHVHDKHQVEDAANEDERDGGAGNMSAAGKVTNEPEEDFMERLHARFASSRRLKRLFFQDGAVERYESAFVALTGDIGVPITASGVPSFLEHLFPDFPYRISVHNRDEFLATFGREGVKSKQVSFADIRKVLKEHAAAGPGGDVANEVLVRGAFNPMSRLYQRWMWLVQVLAVYHYVVVPVRIGFLPWKSMLDWHALCTDVPAETLTIVHLLVVCNTAYQNGKSHFVTSRSKILRRASLNYFFAAIPLDWFAYWCGASNGDCCWLRLGKILFSIQVARQRRRRGRTSSVQRLADLFVAVVALLHVIACGWFFIGSQYVGWFPGRGVTWYTAEPNLLNSTLVQYDEQLGTSSGSTVWEQYLVSFYWVCVTLTSYGMVGNEIPQNVTEVIYSVALMVLNMTVFRFLVGEVSTIMMMKDEELATKRAQLGAVENFLKGSSLETELQEEIKQHFKASHVRTTFDQVSIFRGMSRSLQVEVSSYTARGYLDGVPLFAGCSSQLMDGVSVLLSEVNFAPEEYLYRTSEVARDMFLVIDGSVDDITDTETGEKVDAVHRKGSCTGVLSFFFGMRRLGSARASKQTGAVCLRLTRDEFQGLLKLYPEDEERIAQSAMNFLEGARSNFGSRHASSRGGGGNSTAIRSSHRSSKGQTLLSDSAPGNEEGLDENDSEAFTQAMGGSSIRQKVQALRRRRENKRVYGVLQAAKNGDLIRLRAHAASCSGDCNWNLFDHFKRTPLHVAASEGQLEVVRFLLHNMADSAARDRFDNTPLNDAVRHRHDEVAALIRERAPGTVLSLKGHEIGGLMCQVQSILFATFFSTSELVL
jgi:CRP-like cAMP-binding protein